MNMNNESIDVKDFTELSYKSRYEYTLDQIKCNGYFWTLQDSLGGFPLNESYNGGLELMVWSDEAFAKYNLTGEWANETPVCVKLPQFIADMAPKMRQKKVKILVSVMENLRGKVISLEDFLQSVYSNPNENEAKEIPII